MVDLVDDRNCRNKPSLHLQGRRDAPHDHRNPNRQGVDIEQSLIGRLLGYGTVIVHATGTGFEPLQGIAHPIKLQNQLPALDSQIAMLHHSTFGMAGGARCSGCCLGTGLLTSNGRHPCRLRTIVDHEASKSCRRIRDLPRCSGEPIAGTVARERGRVSV